MEKGGMYPGYGTFLVFGGGDVPGDVLWSGGLIGPLYTWYGYGFGSGFILGSTSVHGYMARLVLKLVYRAVPMHSAKHPHTRKENVMAKPFFVETSNGVYQPSEGYTGARRKRYCGGMVRSRTSYGNTF
jgi:hypothetical protein